jgi:membrane-associated protease RseP (regulator of RpoE activity)
MRVIGDLRDIRPDARGSSSGAQRQAIRYVRYWAIRILTCMAVSLSAGCARPVERFIGIGMEPIPKHVVAHDHIDPRIGVRVVQVRANTPAALAGIRHGDIVVRVDGTPIRSLSQFHQLLQRPGDVHLTVLREGVLLHIVCGAYVTAEHATYDDAGEAEYRAWAYKTYPNKSVLRDWSVDDADNADGVPP